MTGLHHFPGPARHSCLPAIPVNRAVIPPACEPLSTHERKTDSQRTNTGNKQRLQIPCVRDAFGHARRQPPALPYPSGTRAFDDFTKQMPSASRQLPAFFCPTASGSGRIPARAAFASARSCTCLSGSMLASVALRSSSSAIPSLTARTLLVNALHLQQNGSCCCAEHRQ